MTAAPASARPSGMRAFTVVWAGQFVSLLGTGMTRFALTLWAWELTGEATTLALMAFFGFLPNILITPFAGALVDRWNRKLVMMLSDLGAGAATIAMLLLSLDGSLQIWHVYAAAAFASAFEAFQFPAYSAAITTMVDKKYYSRTSGLMSLAGSASGVIAPIAAGALYGLLHLHGILLIDIITFLFALATLAFVVVPAMTPSAEGDSSRGSLLSEALYGFRYILARPSLLGLQLTFFVGNLLTTGVFVLYAALILARTGNDESALAVVNAAVGLGGVIGGVVMSLWGGFRRKIHGVLLGWMFSAVGIAAFGLGQALPLWIAGALIVTAVSPLINASNQAIWQSKVAPQVQGKVFAARVMIAQIAAPASMLIGGLLADNLFEPALLPGGAWAGTFGGLVGTGPGAGMGLMFVLFGALTVLVGVSGYLLPVVRQVETRVADFDAVREETQTPIPGPSPAAQGKGERRRASLKSPPCA